MNDYLDPDHWCNGGERESQMFEAPPEPDAINKPAHYTQHPSGVECIEIAEHFPYSLGCAIKYIWRAGLKTRSPIEDLKKAAWYINNEIKRISGTSD